MSEMSLDVAKRIQRAVEFKPAPAEPGKFGNEGATVFRSGIDGQGKPFNESVATARSTNMAKRIAAALNWYKPGPRGT